MHARLLLLSCATAAAIAQAADLRVIVSGEVAPGVYGRVDIGNAPPPPVFYADPVVVVRRPQPVLVQPIYVHVPPGHAKNWKKHCRKYGLCGQPVYFVKSPEYEPGYKPKKKEKKQKKEKRD